MSKTAKGALGLFVAFVLGCASAPLVVPALSAQAVAAGAVRWEYTCYTDRGGRVNVDQLNEYGAQGWEMAGNRDAGATICFKRPR